MSKETLIKEKLLSPKAGTTNTQDSTHCSPQCCLWQPAQPEHKPAQQPTPNHNPKNNP